jgi:hypothetical protein
MRKVGTGFSRKSRSELLESITFHWIASIENHRDLPLNQAVQFVDGSPSRLPPLRRIS